MIYFNPVTYGTGYLELVPLNRSSKHGTCSLTSLMERTNHP
jgi:hypothetical protein